MSAFTIFLLLLVTLIFSGAFSGFETGQYCLNRVRLKARMERNDNDAIRLYRTLKDPQIFLFTILIGNNICVYVASSLMTDFYARNAGMGTETSLVLGFLPWSAEVAATLTLMVPFFIFAEAAPKNLLRQRTTLMYTFSPLLQLLLWALYPLSLPLKVIARIISGKHSDFGHELENLNIQRLKFFLKQGEKEGVISGSQNTIIDSILSFNRRSIVDVMMPIEKLQALPTDASLEQCKLFFKENNLNNIPLYDKSPDNLIGLLPFFGVISVEYGGNGDLKNYITPLLKIDSSFTVQETFSLMQVKHVDSAVVTNSDGQTIGLVKLKDIIRKITGAS